MPKSQAIQTEPMPMPGEKNLTGGTNFHSVNQKPISVEDLDPSVKFAKWLQQRYNTVEKTEIDKAAKGSRRASEEAYKEGYLHALADSGVMMRNLFKIGSMK